MVQWIMYRSVYIVAYLSLIFSSDGLILLYLAIKLLAEEKLDFNGLCGAFRTLEQFNGIQNSLTKSAKISSCK